MNSEALFQGSLLDQLETINDLRDSLQLSYPELESVTSQYGINDPRIFPYLSTDPTPPEVENYRVKVLDTLATPIREDYVRSALNILAIPIRDDYLRLALNSLAVPIREDYLRLLMINISRSIREDHLRIVLEALMRAIREDCLRTALEKFNDNGIEPHHTVTQLTGVIQGHQDFIKYSPAQRFSLTGDEKIRYIELKDIGRELGEIVTVLDRQMYEVPIFKDLAKDEMDYTLYTDGSIGMDGSYQEKKFNLEAVENLYLPVYDQFSPTKERVPRDYWISQSRSILNEKGWTEDVVRNISRESFLPYKGKKPSNKVMSRMRYSLMKELRRR